MCIRDRRETERKTAQKADDRKRRSDRGDRNDRGERGDRKQGDRRSNDRRPVSYTHLFMLSGNPGKGTCGMDRKNGRKTISKSAF